MAARSEVTVFAGKGGVGKTTCAAATALHLATLGEPTLAISTDATPSLSHLFGTWGGEKPLKVREHLYINEVGTAEVREMWDRKFGREVHEVFSSFVDIAYPEFVEFMTSLLPGLSEEFMVDWIRDLSGRGDYRHIVWDTAPLGQTLALLQTPALLAEHLRMAPRIYSRLKLGPQTRQPVLDIIRRWQRLSADDMAFLRTGVNFTIVAIPEALAVEQLDFVFDELARYGLKVKRLVINNVVDSGESAFLAARAAQQRPYRELICARYPGLKTVEVPMFPREVKGEAALQEVAARLFR